MIIFAVVGAHIATDVDIEADAVHCSHSANLPAVHLLVRNKLHRLQTNISVTNAYTLFRAADLRHYRKHQSCHQRYCCKQS